MYNRFKNFYVLYYVSLFFLGGFPLLADCKSGGPVKRNPGKQKVGTKNIQLPSVDVPLCRYVPANETVVVTERVCSEVIKKECSQVKEKKCTPIVCEKRDVGPKERICRKVRKLQTKCGDYPCEGSERKCKKVRFFSFTRRICYDKPKIGCTKCREEPVVTEVCDIARKKRKQVCEEPRCENVSKEKCKDVPIRSCQDVKRNAPLPQTVPRLICDELLRIPANNIHYVYDEKAKGLEGS